MEGSRATARVQYATPEESLTASRVSGRMKSTHCPTKNTKRNGLHQTDSDSRLRPDSAATPPFLMGVRADSSDSDGTLLRLHNHHAESNATPPTPPLLARLRRLQGELRQFRSESAISRKNLPNSAETPWGHRNENSADCSIKCGSKRRSNTASKQKRQQAKIQHSSIGDALAGCSTLSPL